MTVVKFLLPQVSITFLLLVGRQSTDGVGVPAKNATTTDDVVVRTNTEIATLPPSADGTGVSLDSQQPVTSDPAQQAAQAIRND